MSEIPSITVSELKAKLNNGSIKNMRSVEVMSDEGDYLATLIVPNMDGGYVIFDEARISAERVGVQSNANFIEKNSDLTCPICGKECKNHLGLSGHMRSHKEE